MGTTNATVITRRQLDSIKAKVQEQPCTPQQQDRLRLKKLSDERAERWPNTLQAQRERKERARQERLATEEAERERVDEVEAAERAVRRRTQIEAANKMLYDDTDKPKALRSRLLLSDVLAEQAAQRQHAARVRQLRKEADAEFLRGMHQGLKAQEEAELEQLRAARARALAQRDVQLQQLEALRRSILAEQEQDRAEGELIRQKAVEEAQQLKEKEAAQRARAQRANLETRAANETLQGFRRLEAERERAAQLEIEAYAAKKAALAEERARREAERAAAKEAQKQRMREYMERNFLEAKAATDSRLARDVQQAEQKADADAAEEARLRKEELDSINRSRMRQIEIKRAQKDMAAAADRAFAEAWQQRLAELKAEEVQEARHRLETNRKYVDFLQHQIDVKAARAEALKRREIEDAEARSWVLQDEEELFRQYAEVHINEWQSKGKDTTPMELHMRKLQRHTGSVTR